MQVLLYVGAVVSGTFVQYYVRKRLFVEVLLCSMCGIGCVWKCCQVLCVEAVLCGSAVV